MVRFTLWIWIYISEARQWHGNEFAYHWQSSQREIPVNNIVKSEWNMQIIFYTSSVLRTINTSPQLRHHPGDMADPFKCDKVKMSWITAMNMMMTVHASVFFLFYVAIELQKISLNTSTSNRIFCQLMFLEIVCIIHMILCHIASLYQ